MTQNTSTAVMQRRVAGTDNLDFYPTPPWSTRVNTLAKQATEIDKKLNGLIAIADRIERYVR